MEGENERSINETGAAGGEAATPLFSSFRPPPRAKPAPEERSAAVPALETRLAGLEKKLREAAERENARAPEKEMLEHLKVKTGELETRLRDAQERTLAFAYELKGREEARKESRRETEDLLAAVNRQQKAAEAEKQLAGELERSRERIETLEARVAELTLRPPAPPDPGLVARVEELSRKIAAVSARQDAAAGLTARLNGLDAKIAAVASRQDAAAGLPGLAAEQAVRIDAVSKRLAEVSDRVEETARAGLSPAEAGKIGALVRGDIADALCSHVKRLEEKLLAASEHNLDARMEREFAGLKSGKEELKLLIDSLERSAGALAELLSGRLAEVREVIRGLSSEAAAAGTGAEKAVLWLKGLMKEKGRAAADPIAGSYDLGFIQASLDNLEKCVSSSLDILAHAQAGTETPPGPPETRIELLKRRQTAALETAVRSLKDGLAAFHAIRPGLVRNVKKNLTGE
ncbi:MAG: hypothetical protein HY550_09430 [Elusimicrobia bacterium]|nr:hypothetical protein [Elusimicrobiota bacterium]